MTIELPTTLEHSMRERANALGISLDEAIRQAMSFYLSPVASTPSQNKNNEERIGFTTHEVAKMVGLSTKTILRLVEAGEITPLPHSKRRFIFSRKEVERFTDSASTAKKSPISRRR